jgi:hypothetical protein
MLVMAKRRAERVAFNDAVRLAGGAEHLRLVAGSDRAYENWRNLKSVPAGDLFWMLRARIESGELDLPAERDPLQPVLDRVRRLARRTQQKGTRWQALVNLVSDDDEVGLV